MRAKYKVIKNVTFAILKGKITIGAGDSQLRDVVDKLVKRGRTKIVLDVRGITTIDSSGIGELVGTYTTVLNRGGDIVLLNLPPKLEELFHATQLITVFDIAKNADEAIGILQKRNRGG